MAGCTLGESWPTGKAVLKRIASAPIHPHAERPMLPRSLSDKLVGFLTPLLTNIVDDWELQAEIRDESVTVYYRASALLRDCRLNRRKDGLVASVHAKYVPLSPGHSSKYLRLFGSVGRGFDFAATPLARPLMLFEDETVQAYKKMICFTNRGREDDIVHRLVSRKDNRIVDQELTFEEPREKKATKHKIDLCHFDIPRQLLALVEVKGIHDSRLRSRRDGEKPEVIHQLRGYRTRAENHRTDIIKACQSSIELKRRLGFANRLEGVPQEAGSLRLMAKPILVIGNCKADDISSILDRKGKWASLLDDLSDDAAGLVLLGDNKEDKDGCSLDLKDGDPRSVVFDADSCRMASA